MTLKPDELDEELVPETEIEENTGDNETAQTDEQAPGNAPAETTDADNRAHSGEASSDLADPDDSPSESENSAGQSSQEETHETAPAADAPEEDDELAGFTLDGTRPLVEQLEYREVKPKAGEEDPDGTTKFSSVAEARAVIEGFLFSSNEPLSVLRLSRLTNNLHPKTVRGLLLELQWEYENRGGGLQIVEIAGGYQMATRPFIAPWMFRLHKHKRRSALSPATLETLAIIAYRQPLTKGEIEVIRGVETGAPIRTLQELGLIEVSGRREVVGRPQLYSTTEQFLKAFGLKSIGDLPSISELKTRFAEETKLKAAVAEPPKPEDPAPLDDQADTGDQPETAEAAETDAVNEDNTDEPIEDVTESDQDEESGDPEESDPDDVEEIPDQE